VALQGEDMYLREINCYDILYKIVVEKCDLIHHGHSLMQRILSACLSVHRQPQSEYIPAEILWR
jgi:hypothetical protein